MKEGAEKDFEQVDTEWKLVGTVVGNAGIAQFTFILRPYQARVGDIVALEMEIPDSGYSGQDRIYVWARIIDIHRFNPFFPFEAAQEIAGEGISLEDTVLSGTRDQLEATALILGATKENDLSRIFPLTYPVKPASSVYHPPASAISELLIGGREHEKSALIGTLIARDDVEVTLSASKLVARHMAILAMTGGGKTVAARRIIRELIHLNYPLLILDPHGDYIGLVKSEAKLKSENKNLKIQLYFPALLIQKDGEDLVLKLISQMTNGLTEPQADFLRNMFETNRASDGHNVLDYIGLLLQRLSTILSSQNAPAF
jgi:uncharacterized protein